MLFCEGLYKQVLEDYPGHADQFPVVTGYIGKSCV
jgi:hypothetical protein